ncbi:MAG: hypothetical protein ABF811_07785 [Pseudoclavibacter sp.]|jgi:hypothetical protein
MSLLPEGPAGDVWFNLRLIPDRSVVKLTHAAKILNLPPVTVMECLRDLDRLGWASCEVSTDLSGISVVSRSRPVQYTDEVHTPDLQLVVFLVPRRFRKHLPAGLHMAGVMGGLR